jgi:hypothetical protein
MKLLERVEEQDAADVASAIYGTCSLRELGRLEATSRYYMSMLRTHSNHVWDALCATVWEDKVHVSPTAVQLRDASDARNALRVSLVDASRVTLTEAELVTLPWRFRFKQQAGPDWQLYDPYWTNNEPAHVSFAPLSDEPHGHERFGRVHMNGFPMLQDFDLRWRWTENGQLVQVWVNGSKVPPYYISRHKANWGWILQSCWVVYFSFAMPQKGVEPALDDDALQMGVAMQLDQVMAYSMALSSDQSSEEGDEETVDGHDELSDGINEG